MTVVQGLALAPLPVDQSSVFRLQILENPMVLAFSENGMRRRHPAVGNCHTVSTALDVLEARGRTLPCPTERQLRHLLKPASGGGRQGTVGLQDKEQMWLGRNAWALPRVSNVRQRRSDFVGLFHHPVDSTPEWRTSVRYNAGADTASGVSAPSRSRPPCARQLGTTRVGCEHVAPPQNGLRKSNPAWLSHRSIRALRGRDWADRPPL